MSKAILVIDMPKCCVECNIFNFSEYLCCGMKVTAKEINTIPFLCPLKEIPQKKTKLKGRGKDHCEYSLLEQLEYMKGFNDCIDEILGEENDNN